MKQLFNWKAIYLLIILCCFAAEIASESNNSTDNGLCSNRCSQQDPDDSCWNRTREYYDQTVVNALNDWVVVNVDIDQWHHRHGGGGPQSDSNETTVSRLARFMPYTSSTPVLDQTHLQALVPVLLDLVYSKSKSVPDSGIGMPEFVCPLPCSYDSQLWQYLFLASVLVNIAMLLVVIPFIIKSERRDKKLYAKQISMMQMLKPSKSRNPSSS